MASTVSALKQTGNVTYPDSLRLGSRGQMIFSFGADPNTASAADFPALAKCALGSLCARYDVGQLLVKTAQPTVSTPTGTWSALS
jgi:hypothetical protein